MIYKSQRLYKRMMAFSLHRKPTLVSLILAAIQFWKNMASFPPSVGLGEGEIQPAGRVVKITQFI